jgi:hypothetical protein
MVCLRTRFNTRGSNVPIIVAVKPKDKCVFRVAATLFYILRKYLNRVWVFLDCLLPNIIHDPVLRGASVAPSSRFCVIAIFVLLLVRNWRVESWRSRVVA